MNKVQNSKPKIQILLSALFFFFLLSRLVPYVNNSVPTGYDAGLYLVIFKTFPFISDWLKVGFSPGLFAFAYPIIKAGINPENILIPLSVFSQIFLFAAIFLVGTKLLGKKIALPIAFLFAVSCIQYRTYWYFYVKNTFALAFMIYSFYFFSRKKIIPALVFSLLVGFFHLPTFLILFLVIVCELLLNPKQRSFYLPLVVMILALVTAYYLPQLKQTVSPYFSLLVKSLLPLRILTGSTPFGGAFYNLPIFFLLIILYLPLSIYGIYSIIKNKKTDLRPFITGFVITLILVITKFSFYNRFLIHLDLFLIIFAGIGLSYLYNRFETNKQVIEFLQFYVLVLAVFSLGFIWKTSSPLISESTLSEIKIFGKSNPTGYVLTIGREDPAWLMGYTDNKVISRGFGDEDRYWTNKQWEDFIESPSTEEKTHLLKLLPRPLYIFINDDYANRFDDLKNVSCIKNKTLHFIEVGC